MRSKQRRRALAQQYTRTPSTALSAILARVGTSRTATVVCRTFVADRLAGTGCFCCGAACREADWILAGIIAVDQAQIAFAQPRVQGWADNKVTGDALRPHHPLPIRKRTCHNAAASFYAHAFFIDRARPSGLRRQGRSGRGAVGR